MILPLFVAACLGLAAACPADEGVAPEAGVVQLQAAAGADADWAPVEDARGSTRLAGALEAYLAAHPHGAGASRALQLQADATDDLDLAGSLLKRAREEGRDDESGSAAALALARLDYAQGRPEAALADLDAAATWPRADAIGDEWLYWHGQSRLVLKGFNGAREDFRRLLTLHPSSPRAEAGLAGRADCDAALKDDAAAEEAWTGLAKGGGPFAAQAWWGLATLRQRQGRAAEAAACYRRILALYPASFEAGAAPGRLEALQRLPAAVPTPKPGPSRWWVQVGAYSNRAMALRLAAVLKRHRWKAQVRRRLADGTARQLVWVGPYAQKAQAEAAARLLVSREKLPQRLVEE